MGKKRNANNGNPHQAQSFGQMVSRAALSQMLPQIQQMVNNLGQKLAMQQARTVDMLFSRIVVLEKILMETNNLTEDDLATRFAQVEDERDGFILAGEAEKGDLVRLEIQTKINGQGDYQGTSKLKVFKIGSGDTMGTELENAVVGMKAGDSKEVPFGQKQELTAKIAVNRVSRPIPDETPKAPEQPKAPTEPVTPDNQENSDASAPQG